MKKGFVTKALLACAGCVALSVPVSASIVPTLESRTVSGANTIFSYDAMLTYDQGLSTSVINTESNSFVGSKFVIFDFAGYVANSIFSSNPEFAASIENVSSGLAMPPGATDASNLVNLVFTYVGPDFRTTGGTATPGNPYQDIDLGSFGAASIFSSTGISFSSSIGVKNYVTPYPAGTANTAAFNTNSVLVPASGVPETATWGMMLLGFGAMGSVMRSSRRRQTSVLGW